VKTEKDPKKVAAAVARAKALPAEKRREIARQGAAARWKGKVYKASHKGNFLNDFGIDIECYVLDDPAKTPVISQRGMGQAIGFSRRGSRLMVFVNSKTMDGYIGRDLRGKIENPFVFQTPGAAAASSVSARANGYDATMLIDICNAVLAAKAEGKLSGSRYDKMIQQAQIITAASAKNGIRQLVYALAGYSPSTDEVIAAFKLYVQEEARKYEPEFPNELYMQWHRLYSLPVPVRGKPWQFKYLTVNHIYFPLAQSSGKILTLLRALKARGGDQQKKLFQFLNEIGARALRMHLGRVLEMSESSATRHAYEQKIIERFGGQHELELLAPNPSNAFLQPSEQFPTVDPL
jgi:P63C domain